jgi:hypothetical protein
LQASRLRHHLLGGRLRGGAPGQAGGGKKAKTEIISAFADDVAAKTSGTSRTVRQEDQFARGLAEAVKERIRGTVLEDNKVELLRPEVRSIGGTRP